MPILFTEFCNKGYFWVVSRKHVGSRFFLKYLIESPVKLWGFCLSFFLSFFSECYNDLMPSSWSKKNEK